MAMAMALSVARFVIAPSSLSLRFGGSRRGRGLEERFSKPLPQLCVRSMSGHASTGVVEEEEGLDGYLQYVHACNIGRENCVEFMPFIIEENAVGYIHPRFVKHLKRFPEVFTIDKGNCEADGLDKGWVTLHTSLQSPKDRTESVESVLQVLENEGLIPGWRNERFPVVSGFGSPSHFNLERAAVPYFGTKAYGVHMNGYVQIDGGTHLWVAKRSATKQTFPGMLDQLVAGGQCEGISCKENLFKECHEEAAIPASLADNLSAVAGALGSESLTLNHAPFTERIDRVSIRAIAVGAVSCEQIKDESFKRDVLFCYDLELPPDFQPLNNDGEVESFELLPVSEVANIIRTSNRFKPNCALVVIDFLFRRGFIHPDQPGYLHLLQSLRSGDCQ